MGVVFRRRSKDYSLHILYYNFNILYKFKQTNVKEVIPLCVHMAEYLLLNILKILHCHVQYIGKVFRPSSMSKFAYGCTIPKHGPATGSSKKEENSLSFHSCYIDSLAISTPYTLSIELLCHPISLVLINFVIIQ